MKSTTSSNLEKSYDTKVVTNKKQHTEANVNMPSVNYNVNHRQEVITANTKDHLGVTALVAIMEPATESQSARAHKQPLRSHSSNKIKVLLGSGSDGDLMFLPKGKDKPFPYLTRQVPKSWHMSNGSFQTNGRGNIRLKFF